MVCEVNEYTIDTSDSGPVPTEAFQFETNLSLVNFDSAQSDKVYKAAELIKKVIATQEFKDEVINYTYNGKKQFADNNGLTNLQIYNRILIAAERLNPVKNFMLDVELELYYDGNSSTIGYTYPETTRIWMNTKYFNSYLPYQVSSNLMHEWLHKLGFGHDAAATAARPNSVPYAVGYIVRRLAANL